ncbi:hypothetical protein LWI29_003852 [Acer saccharum]|uniref:Uncharacterized protein n=1 Tax=Acer saccharum TaxID=4024 RepID=A0AA39SL80_ACESA|nr:hypothetical protein LWI29_003852 [Acer saccharum]
MLQIFFAVAFSAVPLTLYVPPIRSLNLFVETIEDLLRQTTVYTIRAYPRIRSAFSRLRSQTKHYKAKRHRKSLEKETVPEINRLTSTSTSSSHRARDTAILPFEDFKWN